MEDGEPGLLQRRGVLHRAARRGRHELHALVGHELDDRRVAHERLGDVHAERLVGEVAHLADLVADDVELARGRLDDAHRAGVGHRAGELRPRDPAHRRLHDRDVDAEHLGDAVGEGGGHRRSLSDVVEARPRGDGAGGEAEELAEHGARGAPHGVADQLEEEDRTVLGPRERPPLLTEDRRVEELGDRDVEHLGHLGRVGHRVGTAGERRHVGDDERAAGDRGEVVELAEGLDAGGVEADLLVGLAQRGGPQVLALVLAAAGEAHLARVRAQLPRAPGEDDVQLAIVLVERGEHRRRAVDAGHRLALGAHRRSGGRHRAPARRRGWVGAGSSGRSAHGAGRPGRAFSGRGMICSPPRPAGTGCGGRREVLAGLGPARHAAAGRLAGRQDGRVVRVGDRLLGRIVGRLVRRRHRRSAPPGASRAGRGARGSSGC